LLQSKGNQDSSPDQNTEQDDRIGREVLNGYPDKEVWDTPSQAGGKKEPKGFTGHEH
jgi:hypothetical protein